MYPDLSYILHDFFGTNPDNAFSIIKTFGLLLVIAILTAAYMLMKEMQRKEKEGLLKPVKEKKVTGQPATPIELVGNGLLGFFLGFKFLYIVQNFAQFQLDPAGVILSLTGNWLGGVLGAALFAGLKFYEKNREKLDKPLVKEVLVYPHERIGDITILAAVSGIIGAKVFALIEDLDLVYAGRITFGDLINSFFSGSGMAIYGGLIGGFIGVMIYLKRKRISTIHILDAVAPALMVSYGVGRIGCQLSGDGDWGIPIEKISETGEVLWAYTKPAFMSILPEWFWAYDYPHNVIDEGVKMDNCVWRYCHKLTSPVFPTPLYEIIMALGLGGFLWAIRKKVVIPGMLFFIYLIFNGFERFWIEKIRINEDYNILGFPTTQAEFISVCLMLIGAVGCVVLWRRYKKAG